MKRIAIIGCGVVGASWALVFARAGHDVVLYDPSPDMQRGALDFVGAHTAPGTVTPAGSLAEALHDACYVQESTPERLASKLEIFEQLDTLADTGAIIASSTSGLPASSFTEALAGRARCLVAHPINPPHLIPLVEIVPAPWTGPEAVARCAELMRSVGQAPIELSREINGFVVNRLQSALLAEAFRLVEDGLCGSADIDRAVSEGLGLRWFFMGPFETIDLNARTGLGEYCRNLGPMYFGLAREQADPREWTEALVAQVERDRRHLVPSTELEARRVWRDDTLAALVAAKRRVLYEGS